MIKHLNEVPVDHQVIIPLHQLTGHDKGFYVNQAVYVSPASFLTLDSHLNYNGKVMAWLAADFEVMDVERVFGDEREHFFGINIKDDLKDNALMAQMLRVQRSSSLFRITWLPVRDTFVLWALYSCQHPESYVEDRSYFHQSFISMFLEAMDLGSVVLYPDSDIALGTFSDEHLELERKLTDKWVSDRYAEKHGQWEIWTVILFFIALVVWALYYVGGSKV